MAGQSGDIETNLQQPIPASNVVVCYPLDPNSNKSTFYFQNAVANGYAINGRNYMNVASANSIVYYMRIVDNEPEHSDTTYSEYWISTQSYTYAGKTVYYHAGSQLQAYHATGSVDPCPTPQTALDGPSAWVMVYGSVNSATQNIPVQWNSPYRTDPYQASFKITVRY